MGDKIPAMKKYYNLETKRKTGKIYYIAVNNKKRKNWDFYEKKMEKNIMEKRSAHITFQKRLWWRRSCNSSGKLNKYKTLDSRDFVPFNAFTELSIGNIKKPCECFYSMPENSCDVLASDRGPSFSRIEQLKEKFYLVRFFEDIKSHRERECDKRNSTPCKALPKVNPRPTKYAASILVTDKLRAGNLVKKQPPPVVELEKFEMSSMQWVTEKNRKFHVEKD